MITVSPEAAAQILVSAKESKAESLPLRLAVHQKSNSTFHYVMGFDEKSKDGDVTIESEDVKIVIDSESQKLAIGLKLDYVDLEGNQEFIFMNPNDPAYSPPTDD